MTVVIRDGAQVEVPRRRLDVALRLISECYKSHGLAPVRVEDAPADVPLLRVQHAGGRTFTMRADRFESIEGVAALEEWLRGMHGEDVLDVPPDERDARSDAAVLS